MTFTMQDVRDGNVAYEHNIRSSSGADMALLQLTDGYHYLNFLLHIELRAKVRYYI
jgi:hypothetical protein